MREHAPSETTGALARAACNPAGLTTQVMAHTIAAKLAHTPAGLSGSVAGL
jgi:hypothetical protein